MPSPPGPASTSSNHHPDTGTAAASPQHRRLSSPCIRRRHRHNPDDRHTDHAAATVLPLGTLEINNGDFDNNNSEVTRLDDDSDHNGKQDLTLLTDKAPIQLVGAGVSTCAPQ